VNFIAQTWSEDEDTLFEQLREKYGPEPHRSKQPQKKIRFFAKTKTKKSENKKEIHFDNPIPWWVYLGDVYMHYALNGEDPRFTLKRKILRDMERPSAEIVLHMREKVASGELVVKDYKRVTDLASISLVLINKGNVPETITASMVSNEVSKTFLQRNDPKKFANNVSKAISGLKGISRQELQAKYYTICKQSPCFGMSFFRCRVGKSESSHVSDVEKVKFSGVNHAGIHLFGKGRTHIVKSFKYGDMKEYGAENGKFWIIYHFGEKRKLGKLTLFCKDCWHLHGVVYDYTNQLMEKNAIRASVQSVRRINWD